MRLITCRPDGGGSSLIAVWSVWRICETSAGVSRRPDGLRGFFDVNCFLLSWDGNGLTNFSATELGTPSIRSSNDLPSRKDKPSSDANFGRVLPVLHLLVTTPHFHLACKLGGAAICNMLNARADRLCNALPPGYEGQMRRSSQHFSKDCSYPISPAEVITGECRLAVRKGVCCWNGCQPLPAP